MRLEHLYRLRFSYRESWSVGGEQNFGLAEGRCDGRISGRVVGANHARVRGDGTYLPDFQGFIATDDGAHLIFDYHGRGQVQEDGSFRAVGAASHISDDESYRHLNDVVCALEAWSVSDEDAVTLDVYELVWEPIVE